MTAVAACDKALLALLPRFTSKNVRPKGTEPSCPPSTRATLKPLPATALRYGCRIESANQRPPAARVSSPRAVCSLRGHVRSSRPIADRGPVSRGSGRPRSSKAVPGPLVSPDRSQSVPGGNAHSAVPPSPPDERGQDFLRVEDLRYRPPGVDKDLLTGVHLSLPVNSLGLVYGRSGSGKTTLLQLLAGLATPTGGAIFLGPPPGGAGGGEGGTAAPRVPCSRADLARLAGLLFQFPERYFLADTVVEELTFGWPKRDPFALQPLLERLQAALAAVGLEYTALTANPRSLSGGNQRKLAMAVQMVRLPGLLLLDEPLAGLDWRARADMVKLLGELKKGRSLLVVSHDLGELMPLVDRSWKMEMGGHLAEVEWPPANYTHDLPSSLLNDANENSLFAL